MKPTRRDAVAAVRRFCKAASLASALAVLSAVAGIARAQADAKLFAGKTITIIVSYSAGGGYDFYGRLVARHLGKYLDGNPTVIVKNMSGAGGLAGANYLYNVAPRDGTTLGVINQNAAVGQVLGAPGIQYDSRQFAWIGRIGSGVEVSYAWHTSPAKTIEEAKTHEVVIGGSGPTSTSEVLPRVMNQLIGTKFKLVSGYPDGQAGTLALERGEIDAYTTAWAVVKSRNAAWLRDKAISILVQYALERAPDLPDIPTTVELANNEEDRQVFALMASGDSVGRSIMAPPGPPPERIAALRTALEATVKDPDFLEEARLAHYDIDWLPGERLQQMMANVLNMSPAVVAKAKSLSARSK
jgi:tripartite-type tricarboxylate transporter receptor subunit TctC